MAILQLESVQKSYGSRLVLRDATLIVEHGERVGLVGVNGSGKSTLLKIAAGLEDADSGVVLRRPNTVFLSQEPVLPGQTVQDAVDASISLHLQLLDEHRRCSEALASATERALLETRLDTLQSRIEQLGWEPLVRARSIMSRLQAPAFNTLLSSLSGGERRRVALGCVLLQAPELLLLDEPTNHLDADTVAFLEGFLANYSGAILLVTHDRYFLDNVATRIVEIEDGETIAYTGNYSDYLISKAERALSLEKAETRRMRMITTEAEWAARKPGAQRKHDQARLDRLEKLKAQRPLWRPEPAEFSFGKPDSLGGTVLETRKLGIKLGNRNLFKNLDLSIQRGERLGIVGPNGVGKTTLLKLLSRELEPTTGEIVLGRRTKMAIFHQHRQELASDLTIWEAVGQGNDVVTVGDSSISLYSYLERFLFPPQSHTVRLEKLSGGERARVLLARLILQGANLLMLDEPTNDLDLMTLRVLEQALIGFGGSVLVVTHDRWFLDRVATGVLAFEPVENGCNVVRYADFEQHQRAQVEVPVEKKAAPVVVSKAPSRSRLSYKESKELEELPGKIDALEAEKAGVEAKLGEPESYKSGLARGLQVKLGELEEDLAVAYARWEELEGKR
jgi:ATP-binding cassette subfamily F protein uup